MQPEFTIIFFLLGILLIAVGVIIGLLARRDAMTEYIETREEPLTVEEVARRYEAISSTPDAGDIESIQPGIIYRPTAEEIEKMNEPQRVKEAKEAMAHTLEQEQPPV